jgi:hypothetical protein
MRQIEMHPKVELRAIYNGFPIFAHVKMNASYILPAVAICIFSACGSTTTAPPRALIPKPGTTVAAADEPVTDDPLNKFTFSVKVIADSNVATGMYDIDADYGPNFAESKMILPKGGEHFAPAVRKGTQPYSYIVGFHIPGDTTFYDYFEVTSDKGQTKMQYIKAYTF